MTSETLKILHIISGDLWAGAEVQAFTLMTHLNQLPDTHVSAVVMNDGTLAKQLRLAGIPAWILNEQEMGSLKIFTHLRAILCREAPDVIHTHRTKENVLGTFANVSCMNVPSVRTIHGASEHEAGLDWRSVRNMLINRIDRWCGRNLQSRVIAVTHDLGGKIGKDFPGKVKIVENGVDFERTRSQRGNPAFRRENPDATHIGIVGRLVKVKRVDLFLEAAALLLNEFPSRNWMFHVFGDGPLRASLETRAAFLRIGDKVVFHGHKQDVLTDMSGLHSLVICSDHEGLPMTALEAIALGVPIVAHAVGGLSEQLPDVLRITRHDGIGYAHGIMCALREFSNDISKINDANYLERFSAHNNAIRIRAIYEEIASTRTAYRRLS